MTDIIVPTVPVSWDYVTRIVLGGPRVTHTKRQIKHTDEIDEVGRFGSLKFAYREMIEPFLIIVSCSVAVVFVALLAVSAPRSTSATLNLWERVGYFASVAALCWPLGHAFAAMLLYYVRRWSWARLAPVTLAAGLVTAANVAAVAYGVYRLFVPHYAGDLRWSVFYLLAAVVTVPYVALIYFLAFQRARLRPLGVAEGHPGLAPAGAEPAASGDGTPIGSDARQEASAAELERTQVPQSSLAAGPEGRPQARFLDRLPAALGRDVVYLKVRSHYVNVVTTAGSGALLMRFADAVAELGDQGMQVHRSYWVARRHVVGIERRAERTVLLLAGGEQVPVSRTYLAAVREALPAPSAPRPE